MFFPIDVFIFLTEQQGQLLGREINGESVTLLILSHWPRNIIGFGSAMAPGGSACKEVLESYSTDYDIAMAKLDNNSTPTRATTGSGGKQGIYSTNGVHELLECPVCTCLMYPPIHQVWF